ncbi:DUF805 domain-containing protein [Rhodovulum sp. ES.010]|uniref:DUF805 domain-containing protein n=1 Tax=Rhodovulum sp. ES.010 TaxID=1882821 RepID=UPI00094111F3|nr:DUF805 domain-containing protein [Rhodovulum sp. ES.010]
MLHAVRTVLSKYATFSGRAARPEYWWWVLFFVLVLFVTQLIDAALLVPLLGLEAVGESGPPRPLSVLVSLGLILPNIAVGVRRLHDLDRTGWWLLIGLIPILGTLVLIYFFVQRGSEGTNRFGPPPVAA